MRHTYLHFLYSIQNKRHILDIFVHVNAVQGCGWYDLKCERKYRVSKRNENGRERKREGDSTIDSSRVKVWCSPRCKCVHTRIHAYTISVFFAYPLHCSHAGFALLTYFQCIHVWRQEFIVHKFIYLNVYLFACNLGEGGEVVVSWLTSFTLSSLIIRTHRFISKKHFRLEHAYNFNYILQFVNSKFFVFQIYFFFFS